jgi:DNA-binding GntR family transcriptional regulator
MRDGSFARTSALRGAAAKRRVMANQRSNALAEAVYERIKAEIFDFCLLPGDRFTETEIAQRYEVSRTPVRDALYRLKHEGFLDVAFRSGWSVRGLDFARFDALYDLRILLECASVERLCQHEEEPNLDALRAVWLVAPAARETDPREVAKLDEAFHQTLVAAAGNLEVARVHAEVTEKIRIIRRLDFLKDARIAATYEEHAKLLRTILRQRTDQATMLLRAHITQSKHEVRKITLSMLHEARAAHAPSERRTPERRRVGDRLRSRS